MGRSKEDVCSDWRQDMRLDEMVFTEPGPRVTPQAIAAAEKQLGVKLPEDYRSFLLKFNGGRSEVYGSEEPYIRIWRWLSVKPSAKKPGATSDWSILTANGNLKGELGGKYIAIAYTTTDMIVLMKVVGGDLHKIGVWHWGEEDVDETKLVFSSFSDLIKRLEHCDDEF
jgi:hypothetical protein